ncbi:MAG: SH3 domain-containing protein, partial [Clostridia bacterium]|nr:SH3 domain-containing protein [Clostridia bacterium]
MKKSRYLVCFMAAWLILACSMLPWASHLDALTPTYTFSKAYMGSTYYYRLISYELTGDGAYDTVSVALTQLGYHEGNSESDMDGHNLAGNKNFVEYNRLYGKLDNGECNGVSYGFEWCAAFASWCLRQAGVAKADAITEVSCWRMTTWYRERSRYSLASSGYTPKAGDLIMFGSNVTVPKHVGIVAGVANGTVYTVEGNSGGKVGIHTYSLSDGNIAGYCSPDYKGAGGNYSALLRRVSTVSPGIYSVTATSLNVRKGPSTSYEILGGLIKNQPIEILDSKNGWGRILYNGMEGWISLSYVSELSEIKAFVLTLDGNGGSVGVQTVRYRYGDAVRLDHVQPQRQGYLFLGWSEQSDATLPQIAAGEPVSLLGNITLYAVWQKEGEKPDSGEGEIGDSGTPDSGEGEGGDSGTPDSGEGEGGDSGTPDSGEGEGGDSGTPDSGEGEGGDSGTP